MLLEQLAEHIEDRGILNLFWQYLTRSSEQGGLFWDYERGISRGCPLSPLDGAFFLKELDDRMERLGLFYVRFMDDILAITPTRRGWRKGTRDFVNFRSGCHPLDNYQTRPGFLGKSEVKSASGVISLQRFLPSSFTYTNDQTCSSTKVLTALAGGK